MVQSPLFAITAVPSERRLRYMGMEGAPSWSSLALGLREESSPARIPTHHDCKPHVVFMCVDQTRGNLIHCGTETSPVQSDTPVTH